VFPSLDFRFHFILPNDFTSVINESVQWKRLEEHAKSMKSLHLRQLLQDVSRAKALTADHNGVFLDYSRELVQPETLVSSLMQLLLAGILPLICTCLDF
jgi:hypothetical protein